MYYLYLTFNFFLYLSVNIVNGYPGNDIIKTLDTMDIDLQDILVNNLQGAKIRVRRQKMPRLKMQFPQPGGPSIVRKSMKDVKGLVKIPYFLMTPVALVVGQRFLDQDHFNPAKAEYYANAYRWFNIFLSKLWGTSKKYIPFQTFRNMLVYARDDEFTQRVPKFVRNLFPWVKEEDWEREQDRLDRFESERHIYYKGKRWKMKYEV